MKTSIYTIFLTSLFLITSLNAQKNTIVLQPGPEKGKDALLHGLESEIDRNYGDNPQLAASAWTFSGTPGVVRAIFKFDLSMIPSNALVINANLSLHSWNDAAGLRSHFDGGGSNKAILQRVVAPWDEQTVTWNTRPAITQNNQIEVCNSTGPDQNYYWINVTSLVQDMVRMPAQSYGFLLRLENEAPLRNLNFASSDHPDSSRHPRLEINYIVPPIAERCISMKPGPEKAKDALIHELESERNRNFGTNPQLVASAWTFGGKRGNLRSCIDFDRSIIPQNALITSATLSLFAYGEEDGMGLHSTRSGSNALWVQRITSEWNELAVNWLNQPRATIENQVSVCATNSPTQNFDIDVTTLLQDQLDNPIQSFGFLLRLQNERHYRNINFASSDHQDASLHPALEVCYLNSNIATAINDPQEEEAILIYPNPVGEELTIRLPDGWASETTQVKILEPSGRVLQRIQIGSSSLLNINTSELATGIYFLDVQNGPSRIVKEFIKH